MNKQFEEIEVKSREQLREWLSGNFHRITSVWIVRYKKNRPEWHVSYDDLVDEAMCFGWVDSRPRALDAERSMNLLSPRKRGSGWSLVNKARVERLIAHRLMMPPGMSVIETAKSDGSWIKLDDVDAGIAPADLIFALSKNLQARVNFDSFPPSSKKIILEWISAAKGPETRARRIAETIEKAAKGERANHWRGRK